MEYIDDSESAETVDTVDTYDTYESTDNDENLDAIPRKRRRILSNSESSSDKSEVKTPPHDPIDDQTCTICLDEFTSSGDHRVCCLKCGHVFGHSCILRWLDEQKICPDCRTRASQRDIRLIYLRHARVVDNSKQFELEQQLMALQEEKSLYRTTELSYKSQIEVLKLEIEKLKKAAITSTTCVGIRTIKECRIYQEKMCDFKEDLQSKHMRYMTTTRKILVSQKTSAGSLFPGYGIRVIDLASFRAEKFIVASSREVINFNADLTQSFVATVSREPIAKIFNLKSSSNENVATLRHTKQFWSCAFDSFREQIVFLGDQSGSVLKYDMRNPSEVVSELKTPQLQASPVKFVVPMKSNQTFPHGGMFIVYVKGLVFYDDINHAATVLSSDSIATLTYEEKTEMLLLSKNPSINGNMFTPTRHYLMKLLKDAEGFPFMQEILSFNGTTSQVPKFSRPAQIKVADGVLLASYNEDTKTMQVRPHSENRIFHELSIMERISDICPFEGNFFGALADSKLRLYKMNLGY